MFNLRFVAVFLVLPLSGCALHSVQPERPYDAREIRSWLKDFQQPGGDQGEKITSRELSVLLAKVRVGGVDEKERRALQAELERVQGALTRDASLASLDLVKGEHYSLPVEPRAYDPLFLEIRALEIGRGYLGYGTNELAEISNFKGLNAFACTRFVCWLLSQTGLMDQTFQVGDELKAYLLTQPGWSEVAATELKPGDVVRVSVPTDEGDVKHTVLMSRVVDGKALYLGANYVDQKLDTQVVSESSLPGATFLWALRHNNQKAN